MTERQGDSDLLSSAEWRDIDLFREQGLNSRGAVECAQETRRAIFRVLDEMRLRAGQARSHESWCHRRIAELEKATPPVKEPSTYALVELRGQARVLRRLASGTVDGVTVSAWVRRIAREADTLLEMVQVAIDAADVRCVALPPVCSQCKEPVGTHDGLSSSDGEG